MNRLGFLKRLGALAVTAMVAEPIIKALAEPIIHKDSIMTYNIVHNGKTYKYWMWTGEYVKMMEYQKEMDTKLYDYLRT